MTSADGKPPGYNSSATDNSMTTNEKRCTICGYTWGHAWTCPVGTPVSGPNYAPVDDQERIDALEAGRDNWKKTACFHLQNEQYYHAQRDDARTMSRLWKTAAKSYRLAYNFRLSLTKVWNKKFAELQEERDNERHRADEETHQWGMIEGLMGAVEEERDELRDELEAARSAALDYSALADARKAERDDLKAEVVRLRDRVQAFAEAAWNLTRLPLAAYPELKGLQGIINELAAAMTDQEILGDFSRPDAAVSGNPARFMPLPFTDDTHSDHAPDVPHQRSGIDPLAVIETRG